MEGWKGAKSPAGSAHIGCSVPEVLVNGVSAKPLGSHPQSLITHCQGSLSEGNIGREKVVTLTQSTVLVVQSIDHSEQYLVLLMNDS